MVALMGVMNAVRYILIFYIVMAYLFTPWHT